MTTEEMVKAEAELQEVQDGEVIVGTLDNTNYIQPYKNLWAWIIQQRGFASRACQLDDPLWNSVWWADDTRIKIATDILQLQLRLAFEIFDHSGLTAPEIAIRKGWKVVKTAPKR